MLPSPECLRLEDAADQLLAEGIELSVSELVMWLRQQGLLVQREGTQMPVASLVGRQMGWMSERERIVSIDGGETLLQYSPLITPRGWAFIYSHLRYYATTRTKGRL